MQRFIFVDTLRGLAALAVVLFHSVEGNHIPLLQEAMPRWCYSIIRHGDLGVAIFFVLSGFVISHSLYAVRVTPSVAARFILRRSIRLDPPYWTAIALAIAFVLLSKKVIPDKVTPEITASQIAAHFFYAQDVLGYTALNTVFWTLCLEIQFYIIYIVMLVVGRSDPNSQDRPIILLIALAATVSMLWPAGIVRTGLWPGSFLPQWHGFLLGVAAYWAFRNPPLARAFVGFALLILIFSIFRSNLFSTVCVITAVFLCAATTRKWNVPGLNGSWSVFLGSISYSLYLIHNPITGASFRVGYMTTGHTYFWELFWWSFTILACIAAATLLWWLVERPSLHFARKIDLKTAT